MLNWDHVLKSMGGNREMMLEVATAMQKECPQCMEEIETASQRDDAELLRRAAHSLKGGLRIFGSTDLLRLAERIESVAKEGDCSKTSEDVVLLQQSIVVFRAELDQFLNNGSNPETLTAPPDESEDSDSEIRATESHPTESHPDDEADDEQDDSLERYSVLVVEDSRVDALIVQRRLTADGRFAVSVQSTLAAGISEFQESKKIDAIILDLNLPDSSGLDTFREVHSLVGVTPVIILTGEDDEAIAVEAMRLGAQDYVYKSTLDAAVLARSILYAIERQKRRLVEQRQRVFERELLFAKKVQQHLLPSRPPNLEGFDIAGRCESADSTSGDFFDFISHGDGTWDIVLADVCGHGIGPAMVTVGARRLLRSCSELHQDLGRLLTFANRGICEDTVQSLFVTLFFARIDPATKLFSYVGAGHPAFLISPDGSIEELSGKGIPAGIDPGHRYESDGSIAIPSGSIVLIMTDGLWEAHKNDQIPFGRERAFELVYRNREKSAGDIATKLLREVKKFCRPERISDDVTAVVIKSL